MVGVHAVFTIICSTSEVDIVGCNNYEVERGVSTFFGRDVSEYTSFLIHNHTHICKVACLKVIPSFWWHLFFILKLSTSE